MVISASQVVFEEVKATLNQADVTVVNSLPLPGEMLNMGFGDGTDTIANLLRTAIPTNSADYQAWLDGDFYVYRVTRQEELEQPLLYEKPGYCSDDEPFPLRTNYCLTKRSDENEASRVGITMDELKEAQSFILDQIAQKCTIPILCNRKSSTTAFASGVPDNGYACLEKGQKCQGDSRDTYYPTSAQMVIDALKPGAITSKVRKSSDGRH
jgi:hypothetical protein